MVEYPVDNHPLRFNAIAVEALLHHGVLGVLALPLLAVELLLPGAVVVRRRLVHVVLALVVPIHDGVIQLQLHEQQNRQKKKNYQCGKVSFSTNSVDKTGNILSIRGVETDVINHFKVMEGRLIQNRLGTPSCLLLTKQSLRRSIKH